MSFIPHIDSITSKATRTLNFVKRNLCNCSQQTKSRAYTSLITVIRPTLEYASSVWDPHHNNHIASIEKFKGELLDGYLMTIISVTVLPTCYKVSIGLHYNTVVKGCVLPCCTNLLMAF